MNTYTISTDLLESIEDDEKIYFSDILNVFANRTNPFKVAKDKNNHILDLYKSIDKNKDLIKHWLDLMSYAPKPFTKIDVELEGIDCIETKFATLCANTADQSKLIVYSRQNFKNLSCPEGLITLGDKTIMTLDRDEARFELNKSENGNTENYYNSQVAKGKSKISKSKN